MPRSLAVLASIALLFAGCDRLVQLSYDETSREEQARVYLSRGHAALASSRYDVAAAMFEKAATLDPATPAPHLALGRIHARLGNDSQAVLALKKAIALGAEGPDAVGLLADIHVRQGRADLAVRLLRDAIPGEPGDAEPELTRRLASALLKTGAVDEAQALVIKLEASQPADPETRAVGAEILLRQGEEARAIELLDGAVQASPSSVRVRLARSRYYFSRGKVDDALRELDAAQKSAPDDPDVSMARVRALAAARRFDEAARLMAALAAMRPSDPSTQALAAEIRLASGDLAGARVAAEGVLARQPKNARALFVRARAIEAESAKEPVRAVNAYREVLESDPAHAEALSRLWRLHLAAGKASDAMATLEHLVTLGEASQDEEVQLAELCAQSGSNPKQGLALIRAALRREPDNDRYLRIAERLEALGASERPKKKGPEMLRGARRSE